MSAPTKDSTAQPAAAQTTPAQESTAQQVIAAQDNLTLPEPRVGRSASVGSQKRATSKSPVTRSQVSGGDTELPQDIQFQVATQRDCLTMLGELQAEIADATTPRQLDSLKEQLQTLFDDFKDRHNALSLAWPPKCSNRDYFSDETNLKFQRKYKAARKELAAAEDRLTPAPVSSDSSTPSVPSSARLPSLNLPEFSGEYSQWPSFIELFTSLVMDNTSLSPVERLFYLRGCLKGEPSDLISSLPLVGSSLNTALEKLERRYGNQRLLIQSQIDRLFELKSSGRSSASLNRLATTVGDVRRILSNMGVTDLTDCLLVHLITRQLDRSVKEAWENSLGDSQEFPKYDQLDSFLTARARALERVEATQSAQTQRRPAHHATFSSSTASSPTARSSTSSSSTVNSSAPVLLPSSKTEAFQKSSTAHPCDNCQGEHYIVSCIEFKNLPRNEKLDVVERHRLCFNCLGRHALRACKSSATCKMCNERHHTLLHDPSQADIPPPEEGDASDSSQSDC